jgi:hypothetical protein
MQKDPVLYYRIFQAFQSFILKYKLGRVDQKVKTMLIEVGRFMVILII